MSKLRADEFVNSDDNGAPSFPHSATVPAPTADNHFASKLYTDTSASTKSSSITNTISNTAPSNPSVGDFWTDTSESIIALGIWNGVSWVNVKNSLEIDPGQIITPPTISDPNGGYIPTMLTATSAVVSGATLSSSKWYKDDVELPGSEGSLQFYATDTGTYKYEEIWVDTFGTELFPSLSAVIDARAGVIDAQPTITSSNGVYSPTTLTATAAVVSNATLVGSRWYKDGVEIPDSSGLSINILAHEGGIYKYEETWTDHFGTQLIPTLSASVQVFATIADPTVLTPANGAGFNPDFDYTAESSAITSVDQIPGGWSSASFDSNGANNQWKSVAYGNGKYVALGKIGNAYLAANSTDGINWTSYNTIPYTSYSHLAYGNGAFVAVGNGKIVYSTDEGESWSSASVSTNWWQGVTYGDDKFVAVAEDGTNRVATSSDGINWSETSAAGNHMWLAVTYGGGKFVAVSQMGDAMYSSDGTNWSTTSVPESGVWNSVAYGNGKFVAVAGTKTIYSTDGINWSSGNNTTGYWKDITFGDGRFVAVSNYQDSSYPAAAGYSTDGDTWTSSSQAISGAWNGVDYVNGRFIAVAGTSTPKIMWSPTGIDESTQLTLTDTTVTKASDGSLVEGVSIDETLTVGETVQADTAATSTITVPVFSATPYTGNGGSITVPTGVDLSGKSLVWCKPRNSGDHRLFSAEGDCLLSSSVSNGKLNGVFSLSDYITFGTDSYTHVNNNSAANNSGVTYSSWNFRAAPGFFDIVTWNGTGSDITLSHDLGSVPGMIITKRLDSTSEWYVYHKSLSNATQNWIRLSNTAAANGPIGQDLWGPPTSSTFKVDTYTGLSTVGASYVAYIFADDTPGLIKCGTYTGTGSSQTISTGFKPKFVITKSKSHSSDWYLMDSDNPGKALYANGIIGQQTVPIGYVNNGFTVDGRNFALNEIGYEYIYLAIAENPEADITSDIYASGTITASSGNTITLSDVSGTWSNGMKVQGTTTDFYDSPDPISPSQLSLTSSEPAVTQGSVTTWGNAQWQVAEDSGFTTNVQSLISALTSSGTQTGPTGFALDYNKNYYVRTKYGSSNPSGVFSNWSVANLFKTGVQPVYADDVFSTYLYKGNSSGQGANAQSINNGIDLAGEGGLVWIKNRTQGGTNAWSHYLFDTERGATKYIRSNDTGAEQTSNYSLSAFNSDGLTLGETSGMNNNGDNYVSWTFRKAPGFFDIVTYTGNSAEPRQISHNLGSTPGMIMIKNLSNTANWAVWHRSAGQYEGKLNSSDAFDVEYVTGANDTTFTTTYAGSATNLTGSNYVAYIFAHDDQSFGTNGNESIIKCGSYTGTGSNGNFVDLGWEPQCIFVKGSSVTSGWTIVDNMRGLNDGNDAILKANNSSSEAGLGSPYDVLNLAPTGFIANGNFGDTNSNGSTYIYMAIRRPHKPATVATDVFAIDLDSDSTTIPTWDSGFPVDWSFFTDNSIHGGSTVSATRLLGTNYMFTNENDPESTDGSLVWDSNVGWGVGYDVNRDRYSYMFRRAPGFFDVVTYMGTGSATSMNHNLGVAPEMMWIKNRTDSESWSVYHKDKGADKTMWLNDNGAGGTHDRFNNQDPTDSDFYVKTDNAVNANGDTYVAYLFASQPGISKVGSYTGTGSNIDVDCGFTAGTRFVLIKRTDSTGDWYVWDSVRGITSGNDPYTMINTTNVAQVTNTDYIDPLNAGFTVTSSAPAALNASGGTYLFLAIA